MKLRITNEDSQRTAVVQVEDFEMGEPKPVVSASLVLGPGASEAVYIHASRRVVIIEDARAERRAQEEHPK